MVTQIGTDIEMMVMAWLDKRQIAYEFKSSLLGGFFELGGAVVDFLLPDRNLAWRVMGEFWHRGVQKSGSDLIQKENLSAMGWTVVDIWSMDLENRFEETMRLALQGQEQLR